VTLWTQHNLKNPIKYIKMWRNGKAKIGFMDIVDGQVEDI